MRLVQSEKGNGRGGGREERCGLGDSYVYLYLLQNVVIDDIPSLMFTPRREAACRIRVGVGILPANLNTDS